MAAPDGQPVQRAALITGAARGMGRACAFRFAAAGVAVVLADVRRAQVEELAEELRAQGQRAAAVAVDLTSAEEINRLAEQATAAFGRIDILVNNAGVILPKGLAAASVEEWDRMMAVNLRAVFLLSQALLPELRARRGSIVNVASTAGLRSQLENGPYCAAKSAVIMLTQSLAQEFRRDGIRANAVCPGAVDTPLLTEYAEARGGTGGLQQLRESGLMTPPEDIAEVIYFLSSDAARSVTGQAVAVDRGALLA